MQQIKPVFMMSPISVAQFLAPGMAAFDLLIIDEASQVRPEEALGAIGRASQIVVVGDQKQLPPTSFFTRLLDDEADEDEDDDDEESAAVKARAAAEIVRAESILTLCEAKGLGSRMLRWHYRSKHQSLIAVSNRMFYDSRLIIAPSPDADHPKLGLSFTRVNGIYDRGGKRDNRLEAEAIVSRVAEHARQAPEKTLAVVTFSSAQRDLVSDLLDRERRATPELDEFMDEDKKEPVVVRNIENVQGDERDTILISVGYGPVTQGGRPARTFGPVNSDGGERRLNVLFTRARERCEVFASFDPAEMSVDGSARDGPGILKRFLDYAKDRQLDAPEALGLEADSPFEEDVAAEISRGGFLADLQVGSVGFRIDIGVKHPDLPGRYLLAVECDGATYHSAPWARERDRMRQELLEGLGWRFHRIWSTDWFHRRVPEIARLRAAMDAAWNDSPSRLQPRFDAPVRGSSE